MDTALELDFTVVQSRDVSAPAVFELSEDARLVVSARGGDRSAFGCLYEKYARVVHGVLLSRVPRHEVEDLVQEVFLTALRRLNGLREAGAFGGWLITIARNRATDYHRSTPIQTELEDGQLRQNAPRPESVRILDVIRSMPEAYRETLILRLVEGMTGPEIAERTGLTPESVRVNLHRGMKQLREKLGGSDPR